MLGIALADHADFAVATDDDALFADAFDGRADFQLLIPIGDAAVGEIVGGKLDEDAVAGQDTDEMHADFSADVSEDAVSGG